MSINGFRQVLVKLAAIAQSAGAGGGGGGGGGGGPSSGSIVGSVAVIAGLTGISYGLLNSVVTVQPGHLGMKYNRLGGLSNEASLSEGLNFIIPWFQRAVVYNIRTRPQLINSQSGSKDLQMVQISLRVLYKPDIKHLPFIYRTLGMDFDERVLPSVVNEVTKAVVAQYNASELITIRDAVSTQIRVLLTERLGKFHILLDDVSITHLAFSKEYTNAIEAKQVAQQEVERAKYVVEKALQEKRTIVIKAQGTAGEASLIGNAIQNNPAFLQLRRIEAAKEIANTVSGSSNKVYINADSLLLNQLGEEMGQKKSDNRTWLGWLAGK